MRYNLSVPTSRQSFWTVLTTFVLLHMRTNCCFRASDQNSDIAIRFSSPDFQKGAIIWRSNDVFWRCDRDLWRLTLNVCSASKCHGIKRCGKFDRSRTIRSEVVDDLAFSPSLRHAVTLTFDPLTLIACCRSGVTWSNSVIKIEQNQTIHAWPRYHSVNLRTFSLPVKIRKERQMWNVRVVVSSSLWSNLSYTFRAGPLRKLGNPTHFPDINFRGNAVVPFSQWWGPNYTKILEDIHSLSMLPLFVFNVRYVASFKK